MNKRTREKALAYVVAAGCLSLVGLVMGMFLWFAFKGTSIPTWLPVFGAVIATSVFGAAVMVQDPESDEDDR